MNLGQRARHFVAKHTANSRVEASVLIATNYSKSEPRPEALDHLVQATYENTDQENPTRVLEALNERVETETGWVPVLKALYAVHRCLQDGSETFTAALEADTAVVTLGTFADRANGEAVHYSRQIRVYSEYLEETLLARAEMRKLVPGVRLFLVARKRDPKRASEIDGIDGVGALLDVLSVLQPHLDRLLRCERAARPRDLPGEEDCPIAYAVLAMLLHDGLHVYRLASEALVRTLGLFTELPAEAAVRALNLYTAFVESTRLFTAMCENLRRLRAAGHLGELEVPELKAVEHARVLKALNAHVLSIDPDGKVAKQVAKDAGKPPSERLGEPVVGELQQLQQLNAWSKRQFGPTRSNLAEEDGTGELVQLSPPKTTSAPAAPSDSFADLLQLEPAAKGSARHSADLFSLEAEAFGAPPAAAAPQAASANDLAGLFDAPGQGGQHGQWEHSQGGHSRSGSTGAAHDFFSQQPFMSPQGSQLMPPAAANSTANYAQPGPGDAVQDPFSAFAPAPGAAATTAVHDPFAAFPMPAQLAPPSPASQPPAHNPHNPFGGMSALPAAPRTVRAAPSHGQLQQPSSVPWLVGQPQWGAAASSWPGL